MLQVLATSLLLFGLATVQSSAPSTLSSKNKTYPVQLRDNDVDCNYYYSILDTSYFAFAIGQCTVYSLLSGEYMLATCLDTKNLNILVYSGADCTGRVIGNLTFNSTSGESFYCGGVNGYAGIDITITGTCPVTKYTVYTAINVCTNDGGNFFTSVYCNNSYGEIQYYNDSKCTDPKYNNKDIFNDTCQDLFTNSEGVTVSGKINSCNFGEAVSTKTTTTSAPTSSSANSYFINAIILFFVALFCVSQL